MTLIKFIHLLLLASITKGQSSFRLANFYQDGMVLQMEPKSARIWGFGEPDSQIELTYENLKVTSLVGADGIWEATLPPHAEGGPVEFEITNNGDASLSLTAWFGDVWVCSGQSNMEISVDQCFNATEEINKALGYQNLRLLQVNRDFKLDGELTEINSFSQNWSVPTLDNVPYYSAVCLFYGERMSEAFDNNRPIGLIDSTWGGTRIEAWISQRVPIYCLTPANDGVDQNSESALWNAMIAPLTRSTVRGAIWYQGEANVKWNPDFYSCHIAALVQDWKDTFGDGNESDEVEFPFGIVQIGPTEKGDDYDYGFLRLHQTVNEGVLPNPFIPEAFFATAYDLTDRDAPLGQNHPRDKQTVADRLANAGKNLLYDSNFRKYGPVPIGIAEDVSGQITITYDTNIRVAGPIGFAFQRFDGSWSPSDVIGSTLNSVTVAVDADATLLTLGYRATVCEYKECPVYSDDSESVPAQVWQWDLTELRMK